MAQDTLLRRHRHPSANRSGKTRTKRQVNLRLLIASAVIAATVCPLGYLWYSSRINKVGAALLERASSLEQQGKWPEAAAYLGLYTQFEPLDMDARVRLVGAVEHFATTYPQKRHLAALLYDTLGFMPDRTELRVKLAQQLLQLQDYHGAQAEAQKLLSSEDRNVQQSAHRVVALALHAQARRGGLISIEQAAKALIGCLADSPGHVELASSAAELYRNYPQEVNQANAASKADEIMNRLVAADTHNSDALLARYKYRRQFSLADAKDDLRAALAQNPDDVEALLLDAGEESANASAESRQAAKQRLARVMELAPQDARAYVAQARLYAANNERDQALTTLLNARKQIKTNNLEVDAALLELLTDLHRFDEAEKAYTDFDNDIRKWLPELSTISRIRLDNAEHLLRARLDTARGNLRQAVRELSAIVASVQKTDTTAGSPERLQAFAMLADLMSRLQRPDLAATYWRTVADEAPNFAVAHWKAGTAYLALGRTDKAIDQLDNYLQSPSASPEAWISLVQSHLQQQMRRAEADRNWSEFLTTLKRAKQALPQRWEPQLAEVMYLSAVKTEDAKGRAAEQLHNLEGNFPKDVDLSARIAICYLQLGANRDAERVLGQYEALETDVARRAALRATILARQGHVDDASKVLLEAVPQASKEERLELQLARVKLMLSANQGDAAQQLVTQLMTLSPNEPQLVMLGLDIALSRKDFETATRLEDSLKSQTVADDFEWRYYRAQRLIANFANLSVEPRAELDRLIGSLRSDRPDWYPVVALAGQNSDLRGNRRQAIDAYQLSVELGDSRPETIERLIAALYADGRLNEANTLLSRMSSEGPAYDRMETLAIAAAVKDNKLESALELAKKAVERGSDDPVHHVWLANLLSLDGQQQSADQAFHTAIERFPKDTRVWNGFFTHLVRTRQTEQARKVLEQWTAQVQMDEASKDYVLAQGFELLGDSAKAQEYYRKVIGQSPNNADAHLRLAGLLLSRDTAAARGLYEDVLRIDANNADARRHLASLLAASGDNDDWTRAIQLLTKARTQDSADVSGMDDRLRAILLARKGRSRDQRLANCEEARRILMVQLNRSDNASVDIDRMLVAGIYEQEALLRNDPALAQAAREVLRPLVDRKNPPIDYLSLYVQFLLRQLEHRDAIAGGGSHDDESRKVFADDAKLRIDELDDTLRGDESTERQFLPIACRARLLAAGDRQKEAVQIIQKFSERKEPTIKSNSDRAKLYLMLGNLCTLIGCDADAEQWYRRLVAIAPNSYVLLARSLLQQQKLIDSVDVCLRAMPDKPSPEAATVLAQVLSSAKVGPELQQRVQPTIDSALKTYGKNVNLLMSVAVERTTHDDNDKAIDLFQRVIELEPSNTLALNNLATLLAERPNELGQAQKYVEQAIAVAGRSPALLDTLGTIFIRTNEYDRAVATLEEAVAGTATDPRYYFHLAVAYKRSGRRPDARTALATARGCGLDRAILTPGDRELLASLEQDLLTTAASN